MARYVPPTVPAEPLIAALQKAGVSVTTVPWLKICLERARKKGRFTIWAADKISCLVLHKHPTEIYGPAWYEAAA